MATPNDLVQAKAWLKTRLVGLAGGDPARVGLVGLDVGQIASGGKVGYGIRIHATAEGIAWLRQFGFPGPLETPHGIFYVTPVAARAVAGAPSARPAAPAPKAGDPYADASVKVSGTDFSKIDEVRVSGTDFSKFDKVVVSGTGVPPRPVEDEK
jgi:hypothetical protein